MKSLLSVLVFSVMFPIMAFAGTVKIAELNLFAVFFQNFAKNFGIFPNLNAAFF